jgi:hypothetical protein
MSNQPHQDTLHFLHAHVYVLNHSSVQHPRRHIPPPTFLLQVSKTLEDDAFPMGETISNIREVVTRVTRVHVRSSLTGWLPIPHLLRSHHSFYHLRIELRQIQYTYPFRSHDNTRHRGKCLPKLRNSRLSSLLA